MRPRVPLRRPAAVLTTSYGAARAGLGRGFGGASLLVRSEVGERGEELVHVVDGATWAQLEEAGVVITTHARREACRQPPAIDRNLKIKI